MKPTVLYYAKCSTCQKALKWLEEKGIAYEGRPIREENPTADELRIWHEKSGLPLKRFFNTSGLLYKEMAPPTMQNTGASRSTAITTPHAKANNALCQLGRKRFPGDK